MHVAHLLSQWLSNHTVIGHRAREAALLKLVHASLNGSKLSLTQLGRHRAGSAYDKHHIKAADRLLANRHLHAERDGLYRAIARTLLAGIKRPEIIVDWSDVECRTAAAMVGDQGGCGCRWSSCIVVREGLSNETVQQSAYAPRVPA
jgi:hypothetical protein